MNQELNGYQKWEIVENCKKMLTEKIKNTFSHSSLEDIIKFLGKVVYGNYSGKNYSMLLYPMEKNGTVKYFDFFEGVEKEKNAYIPTTLMTNSLLFRFSMENDGKEISGNIFIENSDLNFTFLNIL